MIKIKVRCIDLLKDWIKGMFTTRRQKRIFICGDFNIDLLNPNNHNMTNDFINTVHNMNLYAAINRPTRITSHYSTLIDNITNDISTKTVSGILLSDISD